MATPMAEITDESLDCNPGSKRRPRPFWSVPPAHNPLSRAYTSDGTTGDWFGRSSWDPSHGMIRHVDWPMWLVGIWILENHNIYIYTDIWTQNWRTWIVWCRWTIKTRCFWWFEVRGCPTAAGRIMSKLSGAGPWCGCGLDVCGRPGYSIYSLVLSGLIYII